MIVQGPNLDKQCDDDEETSRKASANKGHPHEQSLNQNQREEISSEEEEEPTNERSSPSNETQKEIKKNPKEVINMNHIVYG